jgi:5-methylcytosine-specific restriction endonuclease McrA
MSPIRPENRHLYPPDWDDIRERVLARAGNRCEGCGIPNHELGFRDGWGIFYTAIPEEFKTLEGNGEAEQIDGAWYLAAPDGEMCKVFKIILTVAHVNHKPYDCRPENLKAWCQKCHNKHDAKHRADGRKRRAAERAGQKALI